MRTFISEKEARELICSIGKKMYQSGFVTANDGNMTIRIGEEEIIATPTGVSKGDLTPDMLLKSDFEGNIIEGDLKPTSELQMHLTVYRENDEIMSTAHAHPTFLNVFANLGLELDLPITTATAAISGRIPVAPYANPGSLELARSVIPYVKDYNVIMLANHGPIAWGRTPIEAWYTLEDAEAYAKMALIHKFIVNAPIRPISKEQAELLFDTHDIKMNPNRLVNVPESTNNQDPGRSLDAFENKGIHLDDESLSKLADMIVAKIK